MILNRHGANRWVLLIGSYAFKFPRPTSWRCILHGLLNNMTEAQFGTLGWAGFCPVRLAIPGGFLVVMPRVRTMSREEFEQFDHKTFCERGDYSIPAEKKPDSFGWLNGEVVAVDYGW